MSPRAVVDESPVSEFIAKMRACFAERLAAESREDKKAVEQRMESIMRAYLGRSSWDALEDAERSERAERQPPTTGRKLTRHAPSPYAGSGFDRKAAGAGPERD